MGIELMCRGLRVVGTKFNIGIKYSYGIKIGLEFADVTLRQQGHLPPGYATHCIFFKKI